MTLKTIHQGSSNTVEVYYNSMKTYAVMIVCGVLGSCRVVAEEPLRNGSHNNTAPLPRRLVSL